MSFKTILVHLDDSERCGIRLDTAIAVASDARARLIGVYIAPMQPLSPSIAALLPADVVAARQHDLGAAQHAAERRFHIATDVAGLERTEWRAPAGLALDEIVAHGRCGDLLVFGQCDRADHNFLFNEELIATALVAAGRPLLIVPYIGTAATLGQNVMIAWNGSREASRAVADAMPVLERAREVSVLADRGNSDAEVGHSLSNTRLLEWLHDHGIEAQLQLADGDADVGEMLLSRAADQNADLIVMGGYGHTRLRELVLGGVTRTLLRAMTVPVLMSH